MIVSLDHGVVVADDHLIATGDSADSGAGRQADEGDHAPDHQRQREKPNDELVVDGKMNDFVQLRIWVDK